MIKGGNSGILKGVSSDSFDPDKPMAREEMFALTVRAYQLSSGKIETASQYTALPPRVEISEWAKAEAGEAAKLGLNDNLYGDAVSFQGQVKRYEACLVIADFLLDK